MLLFTSFAFSSSLTIKPHLPYTPFSSPIPLQHSTKSHHAQTQHDIEPANLQFTVFESVDWLVSWASLVGSPSRWYLVAVGWCRGYSWWGLEKLSQGRNFFFLVPASAQLSAYANHEFKIIPTPTQLSAYANHELKNWYYLVKIARRQTARAKYWCCAYAQLERNIEKTAQSQITHIMNSKTSEDSSTYA